MERRTTARFPPPYLFRAHRHGDQLSCNVDELAKPLETFVSDKRARSMAASPTLGATALPPHRVFERIWDMVAQVDKHLRKTRINQDHNFGDAKYFSSEFVSLSGDFRWTVHTTCQKGLSAAENQEAGVAIFETSRLLSHDVRPWRVRDMLTYFDSKKRFSGGRIDEEHTRRWAENSLEYLCWDYLPRDALLTFIPFKQLASPPVAPKEWLLKQDFIHSATLGDFRKRLGRDSRKDITAEHYKDLVETLLDTLLDGVSHSTWNRRRIYF